MLFGEVDVDMQSALDRLMDDGKPSSSSAARRKGSMRVEDRTRCVKVGRFGDSISPREQMFGVGAGGRHPSDVHLQNQTCSLQPYPAEQQVGPPSPHLHLPKTPSAPASSSS
jgi:hypothetical protein